MAFEPDNLSRLQGHGLPHTSGSYLVSIRKDAASEHLPDFQVAYYDRFSQRFQMEVYQPNDGTMEPTDITDLLTAWWHLPVV